MARSVMDVLCLHLNCVFLLFGDRYKYSKGNCRHRQTDDRNQEWESSGWLVGQLTDEINDKGFAKGAYSKKG